jgi:excisionase family DNA binding protein
MDSVTATAAATEQTQRKTRRGWESKQHAPLLVSKGDAAAMLSLCVRTIDKLIATKELPARRCGKRVLIPYSALQQFARRDHVTTTADAQ